MAAHQRIIRSFRDRCEGIWTDLIHDDYARRYLTLHLEGAREFDTLADLVAWSDGWAKARYEKEEQWTGYLTDLERVWQRAEREETFNLGWQIRCALIKSTIHSLSGNIFPDLLVQLVETKIWSPARALAHIAQMPQDHAKAKAIEKLAPFLLLALFGEALTTAQGIEDEYDKASALTELAAHLSPELMREALTTAQGIEDEYDKARALTGLAEHLSPELMREALTTAQGIEAESARASALTGLAAHLSPELMREALTTAQGIESEFDRASALTGLVAHMSEGERIELLSALFQSVSQSSAMVPYMRPEHLMTIVSTWKLLSFHKLNREMCKNALRALATHPRNELLADLNSLFPLVKHLGGQPAINETFYAIRDVTRWWP